MQPAHGATLAGHADPVADTDVEHLLAEHGRTYAEDLGLDLRDAPGPLFGLLVFTVLSATRIRVWQALDATRGLLDAGWTTAEKLAEAEPRDVAVVLTDHHYGQYANHTSSVLHDASTFVVETYDGDLRQLRTAADGDVGRLAELLQDVKGVGPVGAEVFLREVQVVWDEVRPFFGDKARESARDLGLPEDDDALADLVDDADVPRLAAALLRRTTADEPADG